MPREAPPKWGLSVSGGRYLLAVEIKEEPRRSQDPPREEASRSSVSFLSLSFFFLPQKMGKAHESLKLEMVGKN